MFLRLLPYILGLAGVLGAFSYVYLKGRADQANSLKIQQLKQTIHQEEAYEVKTQEIIRLPPSDLRRRYCKWVRDSEDLCLQANIPIP